jgi:uncharacterized delta-60 repeat protein
MAVIIQKCTLAVLLIVLATGSSGSGDLIWARRASGVSDFANGFGITALSDNSTVVTGQFSRSATFGPGEPNEVVLTSAGDYYDIFLARYNPDGTVAWVKRAGGISGAAGSSGITALSDDSIVVTGGFYISATFGPGEPNQTILTSAGGCDMFIARFNPNGTLAWVTLAGGNSDVISTGITALSDNSTVVTGWFSGSATFGPGEPNQIVLTSDGWEDLFIAHYNPDGTLSWAKRAGGASHVTNVESKGITTLSDNSTVVTGCFYGPATFGPGELNQTVLVSADWEDIFIARYNPDGTLAWVKRAGGSTDYDQGRGITALSDNSIVVTGIFKDQATFGPGELNQTVLTSAGGIDIFTARYNTDGSLVWVKQAGGASINYGDRGLGITTLSDNSTVVAGAFAESATFGQGEPKQTVLTAAGYENIFITRYNADGSLKWAKCAEGDSKYHHGCGITTLSDNSVVVTGRFYGSATFGPGEPNQTVLTSTIGSDFFIARYSP